MSTWYDSNEVLSSTAKALEAIYAKYQSADPLSFDYATYVTPVSPKTEYSLSSYRAVDPSSFTTAPPVYIDDAALDKELEDNFASYTQAALPPDWAQSYHFAVSDATDAAQADDICQYVLVLDALNFCFWPLAGYEYEHLASSLRDAFVADKSRFSGARLAQITEAELAAYLQPSSAFPLIAHAGEAVRATNGDLAIPLLSARTRALREIGAALEAQYQGKASNLVRAANQSALKLLRLVTAAFPSFRDHTQFAGDQVFFYKRAQIFIGDIWGATQGKGVGTFNDMHALTCFADYRIPQLFRGMGVLKCSPALDAAIVNKKEVTMASEEEVCLRAATVQAVEAIRVKMAAKGVTIHAFQLDWILWEAGEKLMKEDKIPPHHRTITTYY